MDSLRFISLARHEARHERRSIVAYCIVKASIFALVALGPLLLGGFIDSLSDGMERIWIFGALFVLVHALLLVFRYAVSLLNQRIDATLVFRVSQAVIERFFARPLDEYTRQEGGYISARVIADTHTVVTFALNIVIDNALAIVQGVCMLAFMALTSLPMFAATIAILPACAIIFRLLQGRIASVASDTKEAAALYSAAGQRQCANGLFIRLNGLFERSRGLVHGFFETALAGFLRYKRLTASMDALVSIAQLSSTACLLAVGCVSVSSGTLSIGAFIALQAYSASLVGIVTAAMSGARAVVDARESMLRLEEMAGHGEPLNGVARIDDARSLSIRELRVEIFEGRTLYGGIDIDLESGKLYCIVGENGSGKSTLLSVIAGGYRSYAGGVFVDGIELREADIDYFRKRAISFLPQAPVLFFEAIDDILTQGGSVTDGSLCRSLAATLMGVDDIEPFIAERLGSSVRGANGSDSCFSGGERQKLALAAALARSASVVLLDEPTSSLDDASRATAVSLIKETAKDRIVVCVSHDESLIAAADALVSVPSPGALVRALGD